MIGIIPVLWKASWSACVTASHDASHENLVFEKFAFRPMPRLGVVLAYLCRKFHAQTLQGNTDHASGGPGFASQKVSTAQNEYATAFTTVVLATKA